MLNIGKNEPLAVADFEAIHSGDLDGLNRLLRENPGLTTARIEQRTLLHVATDWPGHFPNIAAVVTALNTAGCDPNAPGIGPPPETPLPWAASSDDVGLCEAGGSSPGSQIPPTTLMAATGALISIANWDILVPHSYIWSDAEHGAGRYPYAPRTPERESRPCPDPGFPTDPVAARQPF
jgi:hypothetical protein